MGRGGRTIVCLPRKVMFNIAFFHHYFLPLIPWFYNLWALVGPSLHQVNHFFHCPSFPSYPFPLFIKLNPMGCHYIPFLCTSSTPLASFVTLTWQNPSFGDSSSLPNLSLFLCSWKWLEENIVLLTSLLQVSNGPLMLFEMLFSLSVYFPTFLEDYFLPSPILLNLLHLLLHPPPWLMSRLFLHWETQSMQEKSLQIPTYLSTDQLLCPHTLLPPNGSLDWIQAFMILHAKMHLYFR